MGRKVDYEQYNGDGFIVVDMLALQTPMIMI
jgi:hypothetical protein